MKAMRFGMLLGVLIALSLVLFGLGHFPGTSSRSQIGAFAILLLYGCLSWMAPPVLLTRAGILSTVATMGLLAGAVFVGEQLLEYVVLPADNTKFGQIEFGTVLGIYFLVGLGLGCRRLPVRYAVLAGTTVAAMASLLWFICLLVTFYAFHGSERQFKVFSAEGEFEDFRRSGLADFSTFVMEDFLGAGFFHLLLGACIAAMLAAVGGTVGLGIARFRNSLKTDRASTANLPT